MPDAFRFTVVVSSVSLLVKSLDFRVRQVVLSLARSHEAVYGVVTCPWAYIMSLYDGCRFRGASVGFGGVRLPRSDVVKSGSVEAVLGV